MVMDVGDGYDTAAKAHADTADPAAIEWAKRMAPFRQPVPGTDADGAGIDMKRAFRLAARPEMEGATA